MFALPAVNTNKPRWADLEDSCEDVGGSSGARWADILDSSGESDSRLHLKTASYESQSAAASALSDRLDNGAAFSSEEPRKRVSVAEAVPLVKKARTDNDSGHNDIKCNHVALHAADHQATGNSQDPPQDKVTQLQQMGFEGIPENMLQEQLDFNGGSTQKVVDALKEHKALEEQAKQRLNAPQASGDLAKDKIAMLRQMGFNESEGVLKAKLDEKGGDVQEVVEVLLQHRVEKPLSEEDKRHRIIKHIKERRDNEIDYADFNAKRPRAVRIPMREPMTPDPKEDMSKRRWEAEVAFWRERLRKWKREHGGA